ncbi:MAG: large conductance mechanosensitive channel protein MscL [Eggerthellaceae bacterium]|nr:large conductance mechanosensitive channel protein MscL [Eggerthellaceae bacterium]
MAKKEIPGAKQAKGFWNEFKEFINRGNVMDMAVGVIIGAAFTSIVTSLTDDIINPFIKLITGDASDDIAGLTIPVAGTENGIDFGAFISAIINFLIVALIVFCLIKAFTKFKDFGSTIRGPHGEKEEEQAPSCPYCMEDIKEGATKCPHCGAELPEPAKPKITPIKA